MIFFPRCAFRVAAQKSVKINFLMGFMIFDFRLMIFDSFYRKVRNDFRKVRKVRQLIATFA